MVALPSDDAKNVRLESEKTARLLRSQRFRIVSGSFFPRDSTSFSPRFDEQDQVPLFQKAVLSNDQKAVRSLLITHQANPEQLERLIGAKGPGDKTTLHLAAKEGLLLLDEMPLQPAIPLPTRTGVHAIARTRTYRIRNSDSEFRIS